MCRTKFGTKVDGVGLSLWALTFSTRSCQTENEPWQKPHSSHHCFITSWPSSTVLLVTWWMIEFESVNKFFETSPYQIFFRWRSQFQKRCGLPPLVFLWVPSHGLKIAVDFVTLMRRALWDFRGVPKVYLFVISNGYVYATVCVCVEVPSGKSGLAWEGEGACITLLKGAWLQEHLNPLSFPVHVYHNEYEKPS